MNLEFTKKYTNDGDISRRQISQLQRVPLQNLGQFEQ